MPRCQSHAMLESPLREHDRNLRKLRASGMEQEIWENTIPSQSGFASLEPVKLQPPVAIQLDLLVNMIQDCLLISSDSAKCIIPFLKHGFEPYSECDSSSHIE